MAFHPMRKSWFLSFCSKYPKLILNSTGVEWMNRDGWQWQHNPWVLSVCIHLVVRIFSLILYLVCIWEMEIYFGGCDESEEDVCMMIMKLISLHKNLEKWVSYCESAYKFSFVWMDSFIKLSEWLGTWRILFVRGDCCAISNCACCEYRI